MSKQQDKLDSRRRFVYLLVGFLTAALIVLLTGEPRRTHARDLDGRYAGSPLKPWFDHLSSGKGLCCSDADGTALSDVDWEAKDGHYRVRIDSEWYDVPPDAVITEPNRAGRTMVWPYQTRELDGRTGWAVRCFMPGSMT
jgi:hypothetical protein